MTTYADLAHRSVHATADLVTITPTKAAELLTYNRDNRNVRQSVVDRYAADMALDRWHEGTSAIVTSRDGRLLDGQHRLLACVKSGCAFDTVFVQNVDPAARDGIDQGLRRTMGDALAWHGEPGGTKDLAAAVRASWVWAQDPDNPFSQRSRGMSFDEGIMWLKHNPGLRAASTDAAAVVKAVRMPRSIVAAVLHRIRLVDVDAANMLETQVREGTNLDKGDPALALRRWAMATCVPGRRTDIPYVHAAWLQAWNAFIAGRPLQIIRWKRSDRYPRLCDERGIAVPFVDELTEENFEQLSFLPTDA
jgi:hypothetical protein